MGTLGNQGKHQFASDNTEKVQSDFSRKHVYQNHSQLTILSVNVFLTIESLHYTLDNTTPLQSHFKQSKLFDSRLEEDFSAEFEAKYNGVNRKWTLAREDELIVMGDTVMIPDFSLTHNKDGRRALIEIIGFWHPQYLQRKLKKVREAKRRDLILLIYESANVAEGVFEKVSAGEVLTFTKKPILKDVLAEVEQYKK